MTNTLTPTAAPPQAQGGKHLTFMLGSEFYGIPVLSVREIIRIIPITAVPRMPEYVQGLINLRGKIIPVFDLRLKFGLSKAATTERTCIVVVQVKTARGLTQTGLIVDAVEEVVNIRPEDIEETPDFGAKIETNYITGIAKINDQVKTLLDIDQVISGETALKLQQLPTSTSTQI